MTSAALALGGNLGTPRRLVARMQGAIDVLRVFGGENIKASHVYETAPMGDVLDQPMFLNAAIGFDLTHDTSPRVLLKVCQSIEKNHGRVRKQQGGPRTLDVDLLWFGDKKINEADLTLPHPRITERRFVLLPLIDLFEENFVHPLFDRSLGQCLSSAPASVCRKIPQPLLVGQV